MKLMHLSDLHLGKRVNGFSMIADQRHVLEQILALAGEEKPEAALLCGDIYDKTVPSAEAVELFDEFLSRLAEHCPVYLISGNHDSAERLAFGGRLMEKAGVYLSPVYDGTVATVSQKDEFGTVCFHLLPFLKPAQVRRFYPEETIESYTDAVRAALSGIDLHDGNRHVLLAHQFVTGSERCESEELSIGGSENVDSEVFDGFDYVALGHLHGPQRAGGAHIRYCGTMLKYSFSEAKHCKSVLFAQLGEKGSLTVSTRELSPLRDLKEIRGKYQELMARSFYQDTDLPESYLHITLTDEEDVPEAVSRLRNIYPNLMHLSYDNTRTRAGSVIDTAADVQKKSHLELFDELYERQNGQPMSQVQRAFLQELIETIQEEQA